MLCYYDLKLCVSFYSYSILDDPKVEYFQKSMRINRPLALVSHNIVVLDSLQNIFTACNAFYLWSSSSSCVLSGFLGFFFLDFIHFQIFSPSSADLTG